MAAEQYDLIVLGGDIAEQIAATLLARQGYRVLTLMAPSSADQAPLPRCPALDKLLVSLDASELPRQPSECFQLITEDIRLEFCGALPLEEELVREFPGQHAPIRTLLNRLDDWGRRLSLLLADTAPHTVWGATRSLALTRRLLRHQLPAKRLRQSVLGLLASLPEQKTQQALAQLLCGLCLTEPNRLSIAEAALKWHIATRPDQVAFQDLANLLNQRYTATEGQNIPLPELHSLACHGKRLQSIRLHDGRRLSARQFLLGPLPLDIELPSMVSKFFSAVPIQPRRWEVSGPKRLASPLLARQVVLSGTPPLRLTWGSSDRALVELSCNAGQTIPDADRLEQRLASLLPFNDFEICQTSSPTASAGSTARQWPQGALPRPVGVNGFCCHAPFLLPAVGKNAALLFGQAVAGTLHKRLG